jgi:6-phosphogluconolactonase
MYRWKRVVLSLGVALALAELAVVTGSIPGAPTARAAAAEAAGYVYVNDNASGTNTVAGFLRHADGSLTPLSGSPFAVGGAGTGTITGSQGALQLSSNGRYLLAVDAGSNQISVLGIGLSGQLSPVHGSPFGSGGATPVSLAVHDRLLYVANNGNTTGGDSDYAGFRLHDDGSLTPLAGSTYALPDGSGPGDILFNADGTRLVGTRVNTSLIDSFVVGHDGRLTPAPQSPFPAQSVGPFGSAFRPTNPAQLFVSNAHAGANNGTVSAYSDTHNGTLVSIAGSPLADLQTAPCWVAITPDGRYLFAVNTASASISRFAIAPDGALTLLGSTPMNRGTALGPFDIRIDWSGHYAYVVDSATATVSEFLVHGGTLTELTSSPVALPAGATPFGLVIV